LVDLQALGSHNSYHLAPAVALDASHRYTQPSLTAQLDAGVRALELDLHLTDDGVWQVFHLPVIDPNTSCLALADCMAEVEAWSAAHPCHAPITIWLEPKDDADGPAAGVQPLAGHMAELDAALDAAWPPGRVITPDEVRGGAATLRDAVRGEGWPTLAQTRGRVLFALLDEGAHRDEYLGPARDAVGRLVFPGASSADDAWAAVFKINDAVSGDAAGRVAEGFLVTSNAAGAGQDDDSAAADFLASVDAGPNHVATDFIAPQNEGGWSAALPGGSPRCHPTRVPGGCAAEDVEPSGDAP
jgi:hypothetical protein